MLIKCYNKTYNKALRDGHLKGLLINNSLLGVIMTANNNTRYVERGQSRMPLLYSTEQIVERFKEKHGNKYDYSLVEYKGSDCRVSIICKTHGVFQQRVDGHAEGSDCPKCAKRYKPSKNEFIADCLKMHGERFTYLKTEYKNTRTKIIVTCKEHGDFLVPPYSHKKSPTGGCPECRTNKAVKLSDFIDRSNAIHGNKYSYEKIKELKNTREKVLITCPIHGDFLQIADQHLHNRGCTKCGFKTIADKTKLSLSEFTKRANFIHNDRYDYSEVIYKNGYTKVKIICPEHGVFYQRPHGHLQGRGCEKCGDESKFNFGRKKYIEHANSNYDGMANLYVIKCFDDSEVFYKVGITVASIEKRFTSNIPYKFDELIFLTESVDFIWDLESQLHSLLSTYRYTPKNTFGGHTECFSEIPKEIERLLLKIKNSKQAPLIA